MNQKLTRWKANIKDTQVDVLGIGISHLPLIDCLVSWGAKVTARDKKSFEELGPAGEHLRDIGVTLVLGDAYLEDLQGDVIFKTPGMRPDLPCLCKARQEQKTVTSEMEVFMELCPAPVIAVTGSDGKTTTTTLIYTMLSMAGYKTHVGGNIGTPLLPVIETIEKEDKVVLELSSFQLQTMKKSPNRAVVTNITPNHLDYHKDYQEYIDAKKRIFSNQEKDGVLIVNGDNDVTASFIKEAPGECLTFSRTGSGTVSLRDGIIYYEDTPVLDTKDIKIPGLHNVENYMTAICAVYPYVEKDVIVSCAKTFGGVAHRIEFVREKDGVKYYNSSIDSSPNRTINTLRVFQDKVILLAGGKDKGIPYDDLGPAICEKVKALVLVGATAKTIGEVAQKAVKDLPIYYEDNYENAVNRCHSISAAGDVVIMSNASTSFDLFKNFEERGNLFKELVNRL